ncbi:MAG TPA: hypothetical protein VGR07_14235, partial [Thermoanaerobaculia bacterium]|nr:hypothetical protein [Thermoanaerobaculia bacterium]
MSPAETPEAVAPPTPPVARRRPGRVRRWVVRPFVWSFVLLAAILVGLYYLIGSQLVRQRFTDFAITQASDF